MNLQQHITAYINCLESPPNGNGRHYITSKSGAIAFSDDYLASLYRAFGRDETNAELDRQFSERRSSHD